MPKKSTESLLARRLAIVGILPLLDQKTNAQGLTALQVFNRLAAQYPVDRRTFERDLEDLGDENGEWRRLGLEVIGRPSPGDARSKEWFTTAASRFSLFKSLTPTDALIASFARQELGPFLPYEARESIDRQLAMVENKIQHLHQTGKHRQGVAYRDKIRRLPDGSPLRPSRVNPDHLQCVNDALMEETMLRLAYRAAKRDEPREHLVHPIGLVIHDRSLRLLAVEDSQLGKPRSTMVVKSFLLHRVHDVAGAGPLPKSVRVPTLDEALSNGALDMWSKGPIGLRLQFAETVEAKVFRRTLEEMPLADDQSIFLNSEGKAELSATVADTSALRRMLQSMAREVRVLAPESLKQDICGFLQDSLRFHAEG